MRAPCQWNPKEQFHDLGVRGLRIEGSGVDRVYSGLYTNPSLSKDFFGILMYKSKLAEVYLSGSTPSVFTIMAAFVYPSRSHLDAELKTPSPNLGGTLAERRG